MTDQPHKDVQHPRTAEGDYRKAVDIVRAAIDAAPGDESASWRTNMAFRLADMAIRMTAAQNGAGLAAVEPPSDKQ